MKIRQGFVSNSSSSSFVLICKKQIYTDALDKLSEYGEAIIKSEFPLNGANKITLDGNQYLLWHGEHSSEDFACNVPYPKAKKEPGEDGFVELEADDPYGEHYDEAEEQWTLFGKSINKLGGYFDESYG